ncbi:hypothetical protein EMEDMD4_1310061 [Sinorhizobium medicae]|uniref:Uncharacterized protein n=1 Tax=Sinorhizobium medicae TaxID=110321 RepID=A0A508WTD7_9HYPH|nr:hypothetical protein EMEDMD4_1310061 [Sinorhizobium medicae]
MISLFKLHNYAMHLPPQSDLLRNKSLT